MKGELDIMTPAMSVGKEILSVPDFNQSLPEGVFGKERQVLKNLKKAILLAAGAALQKFTVQIEKEQEILMAVADMMIEVYIAESALVRAEKLIEKNGEEKSLIQKECALVYLHHAVEVVAKQGKEVISGFAVGDELNILLMGLKRFTKIDSKNLIQARRVIAAALIEKKSYNL